MKYVTDSRGSTKLDSTYTTYYFYDGLNRLVCTIDALGTNWSTEASIPDTAPTYSSGDHSTRTTYDKLGDVATTQDQLGRVTTYNYDNLGRKTAEIAPQAYSVVGGVSTLMSATTHYAYDLNGNMTSTTDPLSETTWYKYDALGQEYPRGGRRGQRAERYAPCHCHRLRRSGRRPFQ